MARLSTPDLIWRDGGVPFSERFGDVYFSGDGLDETRHVFLDGIGAPDIWRGRGDFTIAETGFGTGLNFLCLWKLWRETAPPEARLNYVSVEAYPLTVVELVRAHDAHASLTGLVRELCEQLPPALGGYHEILLDNRSVRLLLLYGDVEKMLGNLLASIDAWFLDGFAPAKNPDMWTCGVFAEVARLSASGARLATFTSAGDVRRGLMDVGFAMRKRSGFGAKRESLAGALAEAQEHPQSAPWFQPPKPIEPGATVAVIGAGIAGCNLAFALEQRGLSVTLYEAGDLPGAGVATPPAIVQPRPFFGDDANGSFHAAAYGRATKFYDDLERSGHNVWLNRGLLIFGRDDADAKRYKRFAMSNRLASGAVDWLDAGSISEQSGLDLPIGGVWFPSAGSVESDKLRRALIEGVSIKTGAQVSEIVSHDNRCRLMGPEGEVLGDASAVVIAGAYASVKLSGFSELGLFADRGQVTLFPPSNATARQKVPVTYGGYLTPAASWGGGERLQVLGSSYERIADPEIMDWQAPRASDDDGNIAILAGRLPALAAGLPAKVASLVRLRATTRDRLPVLGGVPNGAFYRQNYADLCHGPEAREFLPASYRPGLYILAGLGSRGYMTAPLTADVLAAQITGAPVPQPRQVLEAMHPGRFLIRDLKRGRAGATIHKISEE